MSAPRAAAWLPLALLLGALLPGAFLVGEFHVELPGLLFGTRFGLDATGRVFLAAFAVLWLAAGVQCRGTGVRVTLPLLVAATASFALPLAEDAPGFYLASVLLTLATYALVVEGAPLAHARSARVFLVTALVGDGLLLEALLHLTHESDGPLFPDLVAATASDPASCILLFIAFGTKAAIVLLHVWLPPMCVALQPARAALVTGTLALAGMLGWLRFLPLGVADVPGIGAAVVVAGLAAALLAPVFGLMQREPKAVAAYAVVANSGFVTIGLGCALMSAPAASVLADTLPLVVVAHALAAAALLLGVPRLPASALGRHAVRAVFALVGGPLVVGSFAAAAARLVLPPVALAAVALAVFGAALLGGRAAGIAVRPDSPCSRSPGTPVRWAALVAVVAAAAIAVVLESVRATGAGVALWTAATPAVLGFALARRSAPGLARVRAAVCIAPGDVLPIAERAIGFLGRRLLAALAWPDRTPAPVRIAPPRLHSWLAVAERGLRRGPGAGVALVVVIAVLALT